MASQVPTGIILGQHLVEQTRNLTLDLGAEFPFATPDVPMP
jgi:hypothetical protein